MPWTGLSGGTFARCKAIADIFSFAVGQGATKYEGDVLSRWIGSLVAFVNGAEYDFGTRKEDDVKVLAADGEIGVRHDEAYERLKGLGKLFAA